MKISLDSPLQTYYAQVVGNCSPTLDRRNPRAWAVPHAHRQPLDRRLFLELTDNQCKVLETLQVVRWRLLASGTYDDRILEAYLSTTDDADDQCAG